MNKAEMNKKADELLSQMTLEEKISQMKFNAPKIERLDIKSYNWWNEALHGVARAGAATMFPQCIGLAATFDQELIFDIADCISTEARAKYNEFQRQNDHEIYKGLTFWSPNVNIFRDPRWGRGHETFGEDPFLTARLGVMFIKGMQGSDTEHLKTAACAKHYAVHSGPESGRHSFNSTVNDKDLFETYLPAFEACVKEAGVEAIMGAYNAVNGEPCCANNRLMKILRDEWGFEGHFVSDCGAINDFHTGHKVTKTALESAAMAVKAGCDLNCGQMYGYLLQCVEKGLISEAEIDICVRRLLMTRLKLGTINEKTVWDNIPYEVNDCQAHHALSLEAARKTLTLLKNDGLLPLDVKNIKTLAVIGPNADNVNALKGNYCGTATEYYTILKGIQDYLTGKARVICAEGCHLFNANTASCASSDDRISEAVSAALYSDAVILCVGLDPSMEGEQGDAYNGQSSGDKNDLCLPESQQRLIQAISTLKKPTVLINMSGSAVDLSFAKNNFSAVVQAWYPGQMGGKAAAEMLFGEYSPSGRLPITFYKDIKDLPDFEDYGMTGRTYRYFEGEVLFPFGHGLSYTSFQYDLSINQTEIKIGENIICRASVTNTGNFDSDEVVQLYLKDDETSVSAPVYQLKGFKRIFIKKGETVNVEFTVSPRDMELILSDGSPVIEPGSFTAYIGGGQPEKEQAGLKFVVHE